MERNYQFRERMLQIHKKGRRMPFAVCTENQVEVTDGWAVVIPENADRVLYNAARDLIDYFFVSMGVCVNLTTRIPDKTAIIYSYLDTLADGDYRLDIEKEKITLYGGTSGAVAQGG